MIIPISAVLLLLLCHHQCSAARHLQQFGDGIDPIAAAQPTFPFPGGPTQIPSMPTTTNFPSFQQPPRDQYLPPPPPPPPSPPPPSNPSSGASAAVIGGGESVGSNIPAAGGLPAYPSMPSYIPKFPPFPFIPAMPSMPIVPFPRLVPHSDSSAAAAAAGGGQSSTQSSLSSSSSPACNDKSHGQNKH